MSNRPRSAFRTLGEYVEATGLKKNRVAASLGIHPRTFSELLNPDVYQPTVDDELARKIAELLNQPVSYVRRMYPRAA